MHMKNGIRFLLWITILQLMGYLMGLITQANIDPWYDMLNKSSLTPPGVIFGIVWTILYFLLAVVGSALSSSSIRHESKQILFLFIIQILMNWAWTPLFFHFHWIGLSCLWLALLLCLNVKIYLMLNTNLKWLKLIMATYVIWLTFATYLNAVAWFAN